MPVGFQGITVKLATLALAGGWLVLPAATGAAGGQNISITPTSLLLNLNAGASQTGTVTVINDGSLAYDYRIYATPYGVSGQDYQQSYLLKPGQTDVSKWITVSSSPYHLDPGQRQDIAYKISVPDGVGPGGYYGVIFASTIPPAAQQTGVIITQRVGTVVYIQVNGAVNQQGSIQSFTVPAWQHKPPLTADIRLANTGNIHYQADVELSISDLFGHEKDHISSTHVILPQTIRHLQFSWDKAPKTGFFKLTGSVQYLGRTEMLPTRYVLIMSVKLALELLVGFVMALFLAIVLWRWSGRRD